ncbi:hypothetical protein Tdes44962_MAKER00688 [Teratosphaeria destructans]|uniref:Uncharacterized protein n=1 Tax=Teratosphaeria destructans TaxID=418781 RepID=A0A9W7SLU5_9PEZI|nr:hypothetical protein Tdes44962_MAKER00688 [Teratosphaeria destructans]
MGVGLHPAWLLDHQPSNIEFDVQVLVEEYKVGFALDQLDHAGKEVQQGKLPGGTTPCSSAAPEESTAPAASGKESVASGAGRSLTSEGLVEQQKIRAEVVAWTVQRGASHARTPPTEACGIGVME